jgi:DNA primase
MTEGLLQRLVDEDFGYEAGSGIWGRSEEHNSLVVNADTQTWFWNSRNLKGNIFTYLTQIRGLNKEQAQNFLKNSFGGFRENTKSETPVVYEKLVDLFWEDGKDKRTYWYKRCLTDDTIDRKKLGYHDGWNLVPIYENHSYANFQCRRDEPEKRIKYWYKTGKVYLYNEEILPHTKVVYITEGLIDSILLGQVGLPAVSAGGVNTWKDDWFFKFNKVEEIYYFSDNDEAGMIGARKVANSLGTERVKIVSFTGRKDKYDVGDFFKEGGTKESLLEYIKDNSKYLFELEQPRKEFRWRK